MIRYGFPRVILDACSVGVLPVLKQILAELIDETVDGETGKEEIARRLRESETETVGAQAANVRAQGEGTDLESLDLDAIFYLLYQVPYTGFAYEGEEVDEDAGSDRDLIASERPLKDLLSRHYETTEEDWATLWMAQHIYHTAQEQIVAEGADATTVTPSDQESGSTWTDDRALDLLKEGLAPFGDQVDTYFEPFTTALEVQSDIARADQGDPDAMVELAYHLVRGHGVVQDFEQAERWALEALAQGTNRIEEAKKMADFLALINDPLA